MNTREKLLFVWAMTATALVIFGGVIFFQMIQPRLVSSIRLGATQEFPIGSLTLFECDRTLGRCHRVSDSQLLVTDGRFPIHPPTDYEVLWVWVTHEKADSWQALVAISTHRGCFVNWDQDRNLFSEGCYGSRWQRDGQYHTGPAPRDLDSYPLRVENGSVWIDFNLVRGESHG